MQLQQNIPTLGGLGEPRAVTPGTAGGGWGALRVARSARCSPVPPPRAGAAWPGRSRCSSRALACPARRRAGRERGRRPVRPHRAGALAFLALCGVVWFRCDLPCSAPPSGRGTRGCLARLIGGPSSCSAASSSRGRTRAECRRSCSRCCTCGPRSPPGSSIFPGHCRARRCRDLSRRSWPARSSGRSRRLTCRGTSRAECLRLWAGDSGAPPVELVTHRGRSLDHLPVPRYTALPPGRGGHCGRPARPREPKVAKSRRVADPRICRSLRGRERRAGEARRFRRRASAARRHLPAHAGRRVEPALRRRSGRTIAQGPSRPIRDRGRPRRLR